MRTGLSSANLREKDHMEDQGVDERIILRCNFRNWVGGGSWIVLICLRIRTDGGLLYMR